MLTCFCCVGAVAGVRVVSSYVCSVKSSVMVGNGKKDAKAMVEVRTSGESNGFLNVNVNVNLDPLGHRYTTCHKWLSWERLHCLSACHTQIYTAYSPL